MPDEALSLRGLSPMVESIMGQVSTVQQSPEFAATALAAGEEDMPFLLPVDNIIMDEASCSSDYIMPCLLAALPMNLVSTPA
jgi:hypothetical protein